MSFLNKAFENITIEDVRDLISNEITENQNLEYKKEVWRLDANINGGHDEKIREMLKDISSMANKYGGYFVIGMEEDSASGKAMRLHNVPDADQERDRILNSVIANINPRIPNLNIKCLDNEDGKIVLIYVLNSLRKPHQINFKGFNQFWIRHDKQKSPMSVEEIKDAFIKSYDISEKVEIFIDKRKRTIRNIAEGTPLFALGAYPIGSEGEIINVSDRLLRERIISVIGGRVNGWNLSFLHTQPKPSYYGLKIGDIEDDDTRYQLELYRSGYFEALIRITDTFLWRRNGVVYPSDPNEESGPIINNFPVIEYTLNFTRRLKQIGQHIGYDGQYAIFAVLKNILNYGLWEYPNTSMILQGELKRCSLVDLEVGPITYDFISENIITKDIGDRIWQSFGYENEPFFREGEFRFS